MGTEKRMVTDERFEIEWATDVTDTYNSGETRRVIGKLVMTGDTIFTVMEYAGEILCDVDFFYPNAVLSASSPCVMSGSVSVAGAAHPSLDKAWPALVEAEFEGFEILSVRRVVPGDSLAVV